MAAAGAAKRARYMLWRTNRSPHITCSSAEAAPHRANPSVSSPRTPVATAAPMHAREEAIPTSTTRFNLAKAPFVEKIRGARAAVTAAAKAPASRKSWSNWNGPEGNSRNAPAMDMVDTTQARQRPKPNASTTSSNRGTLVGTTPERRTAATRPPPAGAPEAEGSAGFSAWARPAPTASRLCARCPRIASPLCLERRYRGWGKYSRVGRHIQTPLNAPSGRSFELYRHHTR